jgi:hypothetical protein
MSNNHTQHLTVRAPSQMKATRMRTRTTSCCHSCKIATMRELSLSHGTRGGKFKLNNGSNFTADIYKAKMVLANYVHPFLFLKTV